jgi:signal transduction histidine kinase
MKIRTRLTFSFILISSLILIGSALTIYYFQVKYRTDEMYIRLEQKARQNVHLLISVEQVDIPLLRLLDKNNVGTFPNENIIIFNSDLEKIYENTDSARSFYTKPLLQQVQREKYTRFTWREYEGLGLIVNERGQDYIVLSAATDVYGKSKLVNLRNVMAVVILGDLLIIFLSGLLFASRALRPISKVIKQVDGIDYGNLNARVDEGNGRDEMAQLAQTFNKMLDRLEAAFKIQKNFVANASHEMRTPLTSITGQLEVMLMKDRTNTEYLQALESVLEDIKNLSLTSNRLLLLAQTDSKIAEFSFHPIRIDDILWQAQAEVMKRKPEYKVEINFYDLPEDENQLIIQGNDQLLITMVTSIMDNGCKFSDDCTVKVQLSVYKNLVQLIFSDQGIGIEKSEQPHIFEPFYRTKASIPVKGHGIGLSMVHRIVKMHRGSIKVLSEPGVGSAFIITFPLAEE